MTVVSLGKKTVPKDLRGLLEECHVRVRHNASVFGKLAFEQIISADDVRSASEAVARYFEIGLPRHAADDDLSIMPRLAKLRPEVEQAQKTLCLEHRSHHVVLTQVIRLCTTLQASPLSRGPLRLELEEAAEMLRDTLEPHMLLEEREVFPHLASIPENEVQQIMQEMRMRR